MTIYARTLLSRAQRNSQSADDTKSEHVNNARLEKLCDTLAAEARIGMLASHVLWTMWAIIQEEVSTIEFQFLQYAHSRMDEYVSFKAEMFD